MSINILMPALSPTMTEGKLAKWLKKEGDKVKAGQVIAEIETDKATMEVEAVDEGTIGKILVPAGSEHVAVNAVIAVLLEEGENVSSIAMPAQAGIRQITQKDQTPDGACPPRMRGAGVATAVVSASAPLKGEGARIFASPLARRLAKEKGIDLASVKGSGPHGRIVQADIFQSSAMPAQAGIRQNMQKGQTPAFAGVAISSGPDAKFLADALKLPYKLQPNNNIRKVIAKRLTESKVTVPHYYLTIDCALDRVMDVRKEMNAVAEGFKLSVNDFIVKAAARALMMVPKANVSWSEEALLMYERADVSVAVATDNGLVTPIVKDAANKSVKQISLEVKDMAQRAKDGKLKPEEFQGGMMTVSNLGMFGVKEFGAIINPPQGLILAVGAGEQRPVVKDGQLAVATVMSVTGSFDHRAIDGAVGAEFLAAFKKLIEDNPMALLL